MSAPTPLPSTYVYIDGFNLYYRALKGTTYKWLNIAELRRLLLPRNDIRAIRYFTARVNARAGDPDQPLRQQLYLRALATLPNCNVIFGHFLTNTTAMLRADWKPGEPNKWIKVVKTEEKGSDVNIATHLLHDGHMNRYDVAVLLTNDSDLLEPVRIVRHELKKKVGIIIPGEHPSKVLLREADFVRRLRDGVLKAAQFPEELTDANGTFRCPGSWLR